MPEARGYQIGEAGASKAGGFNNDRFMYGGSAAASDRERDRLIGLGQADRVQKIPTGQVNYYKAQELDSRGAQGRGQMYARAQAEGTAPSAASMQYGANLESAAMSQAGAQAAGPVGAVQAQGMAQAGQAGQAYGQARAVETGQGRNAFIGGSNAMRQGDNARAGADMSAEAANAKFYYDQQSLADQRANYYNKLSQGVDVSNMQAWDANEGANTRQYGANQSIEEYNRKADQDNKGGLFGFVGGVVNSVGTAIGI